MLRLSPAADARHCRIHLQPENQAEYVKNQRQAYAAENGGHGGAARPRSRRGYGSLSEFAVEPKSASESVDDTNEVARRCKIESIKPPSKVCQSNRNAEAVENHRAI
jgi:hypothetical protein